MEIHKTMFKRALRNFFELFGYKIVLIQQKNDLGRKRESTKESYLLIRNLGFLPRTIVDVGVAKGTPDLYLSFPDSYFLLIEPLKEYESALKSTLMKFKGSYVMAAAGSSFGQVTLNVHKNHLEGSSLYKESMGSEADGYEITVPMIKVDDILQEKGLKGPYLLKIDAQGAELDVLEGAHRAMAEAEVISLEVSMFEFMKAAPQFSEVIFYMKNHGFVAYDIIIGWNRPLDNALGQVDVIFVKEKGLFRKDHSYSTIEQMNALIDSKKTKTITF
jgi:FkbM family methyltransferase